MVTTDQENERTKLLSRQRRLSRKAKWIGITLGALLLGALALLNGGQGATKEVLAQFPYLASADGATADKAGIDFNELARQVNPDEGYRLPAIYGDLGPRLLAAGVIDFDTFASIYEVGENPLNQEQIGILKQGSDEAIVITRENAHFLLNLFWAVGLANKNKILTEGPMMTNSNGHVENFASTGGWSLATKPLADLYSKLDLIPLTPEQQSRVEEVAAEVYRPCCNNATIFPDCNHGMAMLGLLELMASQGASTNEMFEAAKYINAFWFPQQTLESAVYLKASQGIDFAQADASLIVGKDFASAAGAARVHQALEVGGLLTQSPGQSNSCSN